MIAKEKYSREWRKKYPEKVKELEEQWIKNIKNNSKSIEIYCKIIKEANKKYNKDYKNRKMKYRNDLKYNINRKISSLIYFSLRKNKLSRPTTNHRKRTSVQTAVSSF